MILHTTRGLMQKMSSPRDHFVVLPSNACANVHPENTAGKFNISWENPLELHGEGWRVALVEMNYNYSPKTVNSAFGVAYTKITNRKITTGNYTLIWHDVKSSPYMEGEDLKNYPPTMPPYDVWKLPQVTINGDGKFTFVCEFRFNMSFAGLKHANVLGFRNPSVESLYDAQRVRWVIVAPDKVEPPIKLENIIFELTSHAYTVNHIFSFSESMYWAGCEEMVKYAASNLRDIFSLFKYEDGRVRFQIRDDVTRIKLLNGFNFVLGFEKQDFDNGGSLQPVWKAEHLPQLRRGFNRLYIYASCCAPIRVGDVLVPLLRSVFVDNDDDDHDNDRSNFGKIKNFIIKHPMYLPISSTTINTIEINIRDDSGRVIPFDEGSVTSLTLHFKQQQQHD